MGERGSSGVGVAPFAGAAIGEDLGGAVAVVEGAVFVRGLGLFADGAAAAIFGGFAVDFLEEWAAAVGDAAVDDSEETGFADSGSSGPIDGLGKEAESAKARGGGFSGGAAERCEGA